MKFNLSSPIQTSDEAAEKAERYQNMQELYALLGASDAVEGCLPFVAANESFSDLVGAEPANWQQELETGLSAAEEGFWEDFWGNGLLWAIGTSIQHSVSNMKKDLARGPADVALDESRSNVSRSLPDKADFDRCVKGLDTLFDTFKSAVNSDISQLDTDKLATALKPLGFDVTRKSVKGGYTWDWKFVGGGILGILVAGTAAVVLPFLSPIAPVIRNKFAKTMSDRGNSIWDRGWDAASLKAANPVALKLLEQIEEMKTFKSVAKSKKNDAANKAAFASNVKLLSQVQSVYIKTVINLCRGVAHASRKKFLNIQ